jgi:hypothetical protein
MKLSSCYPWIWVCALLLGCDPPPDQYNEPDGSIGGDDSDSLDGPDECPHNSGYPCTCDNPGGDCADESRCIWVEGAGDGSLGFCSAVCYEPYTPCVKTGFAAASECVLEGGGASFRCALVCEHDEDCPPDQGCADVGWTMLCHP